MNSTVIDRIRKMLARAKDQEGTPEGEVAARLARNLMAQHAIEMADLTLAEQAEQDPLEEGVIDIGSRARWRRILFAEVCDHAGCKGLWFNTDTYGMVFGHRSGIQIADYLYTLLRRQIEKLADAYSKGLPDWLEKGEKRSAYVNFCGSAVQALGYRLAQMRQKAQGEDPKGTALVLARTTAAKELAESAVGKARGHKLSNDFNLAGYKAGQTIALHDALESAATPTKRIA